MAPQLRRIAAQVSVGDVLFTRHGAREASEELISLDEISDAVVNGMILEDYPKHERGPCCLVYGKTKGGRDLHVVVTSDLSPVLVITVYEPRLPYWTSPTERGGR